MGVSNKTFTHKFFGWLEAEAYRHINPDGSEGAIVAVTAQIAEGLTFGDTVQVGPKASIGEGARIGPKASIGCEASVGCEARVGYRASIGPNASVGDGASVNAGDWFVTHGPIGSENRHTTAVYSAEKGLRWWTGCFQDKTTDEFYAAIAKTHGGSDSDHGEAYRWLTESVLAHPELKRRMGAL